MDLFSGCCDCEPSTELTYTHCGVMLDALDNQGLEPVLSEADSIPIAAFGLSLSLVLSQELCRHRPHSLWLSNSAYAFSCDCPPEVTFAPLEQWSDVRIITLLDLDEEHPAGTLVNDVFFERQSVEPFFTAGSLDVARSFSYELPSTAEPWTDILLDVTAGQVGYHRFRLELELNDGRELVAETDSIYLY